MEIFDWDVAAAGNGFAAPDGFPEGMNYSDVNNAAREIMAVQARHHADTNGSLITGGSGNAYTLTSNKTIGAYANGQRFVFRVDRNNTGTPTLNVSSLGALTVVRADGSGLGPGEFRANGVYAVTYSAGVWVSSIHQSTTETAGIVELATTTEVVSGVDLTRAVTPEGLSFLFNHPSRQNRNVTSGHQKIGSLTVQWGRTGDLGNLGAGVLSGSTALNTTFPNGILMATCFGVALSGVGDVDVVVWYDSAGSTASSIAYKYKESGPGVQANWAIGWIVIGH